MGEGRALSRTDEIRRIVAAQRGAGPTSLEQWIHNLSHRVSTEEEMNEAVLFCREILDAVPLMFDKVREVAAERGIASVVEPLVRHAEGYFVSEDDLLPEARLGELGLIDDAYVAFQVLELLQSERNPLLQVDLRRPIGFLAQVLGDDVTEQLDGVVREAQGKLHARMQQLREASRQRAQAERERPAPAPPRPVAARPAPEPERRQCMSCSGSGTVTCGSCGGYGSHTQSSTRVDWEGNAEYVTEDIPCGCSGGSVTCPRCGGARWT